MSVFITIEKYFDLLVYKTVQVSIAKKTGLNILEFFLDQLIRAASFIGAME